MSLDEITHDKIENILFDDDAEIFETKSLTEYLGNMRDLDLLQRLSKEVICYRQTGFSFLISNLATWEEAPRPKTMDEMNTYLRLMRRNYIAQTMEDLPATASRAEIAHRKATIFFFHYYLREVQRRMRTWFDDFEDVQALGRRLTEYDFIQTFTHARYLAYLVESAIEPAGLDPTLVFREAGVEVDTVDPDDRTALTWASGCAVDKVIPWRDYEKNDHFTFPAEDGKVKVVSFLLEANARVDHRDALGMTPLMWACTVNHVGVVRKLLTAKAAVNGRSDDGSTPLMFAARYGCLETVRVLLAAGADIECKDDEGYTPLVLAVCNGHLDIYRALADAGAQVHERNYKMRTMLMCAAIGSNKALLRLFLQANVDLEARDIEGRTALWLAADASFRVGLRLLAAAGANVNVRDWNDVCILDMVGNNVDRSDLKLFLELGADVHSRNSKGQPPAITIALNNEPEETMELLVKAGVDLETVDNEGKTALFHSLESYSVLSISGLLQYKARVDVQYDDQTPLMMLMNLEEDEDYEYLLEFLLKRAQEQLKDVPPAQPTSPIRTAVVDDATQALVAVPNAGAVVPSAPNSVESTLTDVKSTATNVSGTQNTSSSVEDTENAGAIALQLLWRLFSSVDASESTSAQIYGLLTPLCEHMLLSHGATASTAVDRLPATMAKPYHSLSTLPHGISTLKRLLGSLLKLLVSDCDSLVDSLSDAPVADFPRGRVTNTRYTAALLQCALEHHIPQAAAALTAVGADINARDSTGKTALMWAAGAFVCSSEALRRRVLFAPRDGDAKLARVLVSAKADVDAADNDGMTALMWACVTNQSKVVDELLTSRARVNKRNNARESALLLAARHGSVSAVRSLCLVGTKHPLQDSHGFTALIYAMFEGDPQGHGLGTGISSGDASTDATIDAQLSSVKRWQSSELTARYTAVMDILVHHAVSVQTRDTQRRTPLMLAVMCDHKPAVTKLLVNSAKINATDNHGNRAIMFATAHTLPELLSHGCKVNIKNHAGETPLLRAIFKNDVEVVRLLLHHGASVDELNADESLLRRIGECVSAEVADVLVNAGVRLSVDIINKRQEDEEGKAPQEEGAPAREEEEEESESVHKVTVMSTDAVSSNGSENDAVDDAHVVDDVGMRDFDIGVREDQESTVEARDGDSITTDNDNGEDAMLTATFGSASTEEQTHEATESPRRKRTRYE